MSSFYYKAPSIKKILPAQQCSQCLTWHCIIDLYIIILTILTKILLFLLQYLTLIFCMFSYNLNSFNINVCTQMFFYCVHYSVSLDIYISLLTNLFLKSLTKIFIKYCMCMCDWKAFCILLDTWFEWLNTLWFSVLHLLGPGMCTCLLFNAHVLLYHSFEWPVLLQYVQNWIIEVFSVHLFCPPSVAWLLSYLLVYRCTALRALCGLSSEEHNSPFGTEDCKKHHAWTNSQQTN